MEGRCPTGAVCDDAFCLIVDPEVSGHCRSTIKLLKPLALGALSLSVVIIIGRFVVIIGSFVPALAASFLPCLSSI